MLLIGKVFNLFCGMRKVISKSNAKRFTSKFIQFKKKIGLIACTNYTPGMVKKQ